MDVIQYNGERYPVRSIYVPDWGERVIATESLENLLIKDGLFVSDEARNIDDEIFYYVSDDKFSITDEQLGRIIATELA